MIQPGCVAEFDSEARLLDAIRFLRSRNYHRLDVFAPFAIAGVDEALGLRRSWIDWLVFPLAFGGAGLGYLIQWYVNAVDYPLDVGGRPPHAWATFVPIAFETGILLGGVGAFVLFFLLTRLPRLWQPIFDVEGFSSASVDRFWLAIDRRDLSGGPQHELDLLARLGAARVALVGERREEPG